MSDSQRIRINNSALRAAEATKNATDDAQDLLALYQRTNAEKDTHITQLEAQLAECHRLMDAVTNNTRIIATPLPDGPKHITIIRSSPENLVASIDAIAEYRKEKPIGQPDTTTPAMSDNEP